MNNHHNRRQALDTFHTIDLPPLCPTCRQTTTERDQASRAAALWQERAEYWRTYGLDEHDNAKSWRAAAWLLAAAYIAALALAIFN